MSTISTLYDEVQALCLATFPTYNEIPFPYLLDKNPISLMEKAYGIIFGPAEPFATQYSGCEQRLLTRDLSIALVNQAGYIASGDLTGVEAGTKAMLEAMFSLYSAMEQESPLASAIRVNYLGDSGVDFGLINGGAFAAIIVDFEVLYQEGI